MLRSSWASAGPQRATQTSPPRLFIYSDFPQRLEGVPAHRPSRTQVRCAALPAPWGAAAGRWRRGSGPESGARRGANGSAPGGDLRSSAPRVAALRSYCRGTAHGELSPAPGALCQPRWKAERKKKKNIQKKTNQTNPKQTNRQQVFNPKEGEENTFRTGSRSREERICSEQSR